MTAFTSGGCPVPRKGRSKVRAETTETVTVAVSNAFPGGSGGDGEVNVHVAEEVERFPPPPRTPPDMLPDGVHLPGRVGGKTAAMEAARAMLALPEFDAAADAVARLDAAVEKLGATAENLIERSELYREADRRKILLLLETDAELRDLVARWMATHAALTRANDGEPPTAYLEAMGEQMERSHSYTVGSVARRIEPDLALLGLDDVWTGRLVKMASAAGTTPQKYLERLVRRAWVSLPSTMRVGS
jgi:hypothetical protein